MAETAIAVAKPRSELERVADAFAASRLFPDVKSAVQAAARLQLGRSLGLSDYASMTGLFTSQSGRVTMSANLMASLIKTYSPSYLKGPKYRYDITEHTEKVCSIDMYEKVEDYTDAGKQIFKWKKIGSSSFSEADAAKAGLTTGPNKANYAKYPRNMLYARLVSNIAKWFCADAFAGEPAYLPDEVPGTGAVVDYETLEVVTVNDAPIDATDSNRKVMAALIADTATDPTALLGHYKKSSFDELSDAEVEHAIKVLETKKKSQ